MSRSEKSSTSHTSKSGTRFSDAAKKEVRQLIESSVLPKIDLDGFLFGLSGDVTHAYDLLPPMSPVGDRRAWLSALRKQIDAMRRDGVWDETSMATVRRGVTEASSYESQAVVLVRSLQSCRSIGPASARARLATALKKAAALLDAEDDQPISRTGTTKSRSDDLQYLDEGVAEAFLVSTPERSPTDVLSALSTRISDRLEVLRKKSPKSPTPRHIFIKLMFDRWIDTFGVPPAIYDDDRVPPVASPFVRIATIIVSAAEAPHAPPEITSAISRMAERIRATGLVGRRSLDFGTSSAE